MDCKAMKFQLPSGRLMPLIGFGTFQIHGRSLIREVLDYALAAGYRQIDTAAVYGNEEDIGHALKELLPKYNLRRGDIFITSKLSPSDQGDQALQALQQSVENLNSGYLDLYLIHWPGAQGIPGNHPDNVKLRSASWEALMKGVELGLVRDIGVSNYTVRHLNELLSKNYSVRPAVNQVEWHPHCHGADLKNFCKSQGILLQAYSSLGGSNNPRLIKDPAVVQIATKIKKSPAQVLLRWALQQNIGIIPKARSKEHIEANIDLNFVISDGDMNTLSNMTKKEKYAWDPERIT
ncbi:hypothetical protein Zmor_006681 [Zophobas morio]|uniref:NADP-dependent oxidoreductase domain-containing protein n=1 Tax=Zophobas morio TaxID=2755281 RepID=A0AA38ISP6_9CUCU|nr:hypothetical protein Zmor_006681 [Zophobas morio]